MKVNVYDFDKTIFLHDSAVEFVKYTFTKHPFLVSLSLIKAFPYGLLYLVNSNYLKILKEQIMSFVPKINNLDDYLNEFWNEKYHLVNKWYIDIKEEDDVILSANYEFIIKPICEKLGVKHFIATPFDIKSGKITGIQCRKKAKLELFREKYPNFIINKTYSDSKNDIPLLESGNPGYVVKGTKLIEYYKGYFK